VFVAPGSLAGLPATSVPIGRADGLPIGGQLIAPWLHEERMITAALGLEAAIEATREVR
jgi:aspartyl-tRNA(Asn)/glutamyl-tRNA(Gln) amidotransferase subunit A